jgi:hypothetical protein
MGVLTDYFSASSDKEAASAIDRLGGPSQPSTDPSAKAPFDTVQAKNLDPVVVLGTLEALLTGRDYQDIVKGPHAGRLLAGQDDYHLLVLTVTDGIQAALAAASDDELAEVAVPWSQTEELKGAEPENLAGLLQELAGLARRAADRNERLYCWVCV